MNLLPGLPEDILAKMKEPLISQVGTLTLLTSPASFKASLSRLSDLLSNSVHPEHRRQMLIE